MKKLIPYDAEMIAGSEIKEIQLDKIKLDLDNVRFLHKERLSDKEIEKAIWEEQDTKNLYKQILSVGGLYEEPIINSEFIVIEGNRRIVCLRKLKEAANNNELPGISKGQFDMVKCKILPKEISPQVINIFLARVHVKGKKPWKAFNKAKHIFNLHELMGLTYDDLSKKLGMGKSTVIRAVEVYAATEKYGKKYTEDEEWFSKFTYFDELYKRKDLKDFRKDKKNFEKFENWLFHEKFQRDVRKVRKLSQLLQDKEAMKEFEKNGFDAAMEIIGIKDPSINSSEFKKIKETIDVIRNFTRKELSKTVNDSSRLNLLNSLKKEIDGLLKDIKSIKKT